MTIPFPCARWAPLLWSATLGLVVSLTGRAADWQSLLGNSPFGQTAAAPAPATGEVEFRGVVQEEGVYLVNLYNPTTKASQWIPVNGKAPGLEVKSYDAGSDKVQVTSAGRPLTLPLKQARVTLVATNAAPVNANPAEGGAAGDDPEARRAQVRDMIRARLQNGPNGEPSPLMQNLPPEAQQMIEDFRRRRAERAANGDQTDQTQQPQGQTQGQGQRRRITRP